MSTNSYAFACILPQHSHRWNYCSHFGVLFFSEYVSPRPLFLYLFRTLHCCSPILQLLSNSYYCCINDNNFVNHLRITVCIVSEVEWFCSTVVVNYASSCGGSNIIIGRPPADGSCGGGGYCTIINCSSSVVTLDLKMPGFSRAFNH